MKLTNDELLTLICHHADHISGQSYLRPQTENWAKKDAISGAQRIIELANLLDVSVVCS